MGRAAPAIISPRRIKASDGPAARCFVRSRPLASASPAEAFRIRYHPLHPLKRPGVPMRMIIVRHGESEWNRIHRYQGQADAPLSELGARQAEALAHRLRNERLAAIYTSPLQRAARTAEAIARHHPSVPFFTEPALLEIDHGEWQGKFIHEIVEQFGDGLREWREHPTRAQMPGGESFSNIL